MRIRTAVLEVIVIVTLIGLVVTLALTATASATSREQWSPWFTRTESLRPSGHATTVVVPVKIGGETYVCVITEDSMVGGAGGYGHDDIGDPAVAIAQSCDFDVDRSGEHG